VGERPRSTSTKPISTPRPWTANATSPCEDIEQEIADVQRALVRLDRGTYGRCEACGTQIPDERLIAMPAARLCLEHQAAAEMLTGLVT
jgi:RNA polymerase-binding transcription factor DksA